MLWVTQSLLKTPGLKPLRILLPNWAVLYFGFFSDRETLELSTDLCNITGFAKLYCNTHFTSPVIIRFLFNVFFCQFTYGMWSGLRAKNNKNNIFNVGNYFIKNYENLNELQDACFCRVKQIRIHNNYCDYINIYFITPWSIKINWTSATVGGWGD